ncbi:MAG TPA: PmoA family protein [Terriglobia bacterium]|nr:PmoA family protein [Terriglobia bacterium]
MSRSKIWFSLFLLLAGAFLAGPCTYAADESVQVQRRANRIDVIIGGKPFTTYYFDPAVAKPYFMPLRTAQGTIITRGFPIGNTVPPEHQHDRSLEPHQRPMYFGHGNVDGIDFWGEALWPKWSDGTVFGRTVLDKVEEVQAGANSGTIRALFHLVGPRGRVVADESQAFVFRGDQDTRMIDCEITIAANHGADVTMGDTKEGSFAIRVVKELYSPPGHMVNSEGGVGEKQIWGKRASWVDYYGKVGDEELGVAIFDSPKSFRHPTYWHARGYGLFAVNPFGIREFTGDKNNDGSWTIPQGKSLTLLYRVFIHHGDYKQAHVAEAYQQYAAGQ